MRAALFEAQGQPLRVRDDVEIEAPRSGQVRVRVAHCGICHSDLSFVDGTFPGPLPIVLGHEAAGVVDAVGPGVEGLAVGDPVVLTPCPPCGTCYWCVRGEPSVCVDSSGLQTNAFPDGRTGLSRGGQTVYRGLNVAAFGEYSVVSANGAVRIPTEVPLDVACVIGCAVQTGVGAVLNTAGVEEGATVLVMGLGGVGLSTVQGARVAGAARILASDPLAERREVAKRFGATDLIDPTSEDVVGRARDLTGPAVRASSTRAWPPCETVARSCVWGRRLSASPSHWRQPRSSSSRASGCWAACSAAATPCAMYPGCSRCGRPGAWISRG
jgi:Zn-dependent alcohol dehydrogenase